MWKGVPVCASPCVCVTCTVNGDPTKRPDARMSVHRSSVYLPKAQTFPSPRDQSQRNGYQAHPQKNSLKPHAHRPPYGEYVKYGKLANSDPGY